MIILKEIMMARHNEYDLEPEEALSLICDLRKGGNKCIYLDGTFTLLKDIDIGRLEQAREVVITDALMGG